MGWATRRIGNEKSAQTTALSREDPAISFGRRGIYRCLCPDAAVRATGLPRYRASIGSPSLHGLEFRLVRWPGVRSHRLAPRPVVCPHQKLRQVLRPGQEKAGPLTEISRGCRSRKRPTTWSRDRAPARSSRRPRKAASPSSGKRTGGSWPAAESANWRRKRK